MVAEFADVSVKIESTQNRSTILWRGSLLESLMGAGGVITGRVAVEAAVTQGWNQVGYADAGVAGLVYTITETGLSLLNCPDVGTIDAAPETGGSVAAR